MNRGPLGLPPQVRACLFDLDGVLTRTATVHNVAWTQTFDTYLAELRGPPPTASRRRTPPCCARRSPAEIR